MNPTLVHSKNSYVLEGILYESLVKDVNMTIPSAKVSL